MVRQMGTTIPRGGQQVQNRTRPGTGGRQQAVREFHQNQPGSSLVVTVGSQQTLRSPQYGFFVPLRVGFENMDPSLLQLLLFFGR